VFQVGGWLRLAIVGLVAVLATGCNSNQAITNPATEPAREIDTLWWAMFVGAMVVFGAVVALLVIAFVRRRRPEGPSHEDRGPYMVIVGGGLAAPIVVLAILFGFVIHVMPATSAPPGPTRLTVDVIGHQWFWEVRYHGTSAVTANEIHIPADTAVDVRVTTDDVIHSFWVPRLGPKTDMIPGMHNDLWLQADHPGIYRGQCAEYCGLQHANMIIRVVADPPGDFDRWMAAQAEPAAPSDAAGRQLFETQTCAGCHRVRGTAAQGAVGPDLTHFGGRATLGAGVLPLSPDNLRRWITDPQGVKPGVTMPPTTLSAADLDHLVTYLEGLH
jgi:cytochrome c oxidase subunit 2